MIKYILGILILIDFLLLWKRSRKFIGKVIKRKISERKQIADNMMIGLLAGLMVSSLVYKDNPLLIFSLVLILIFMITRGFEYKKK